MLATSMLDSLSRPRCPDGAQNEQDLNTDALTTVSRSLKFFRVSEYSPTQDVSRASPNPNTQHRLRTFHLGNESLSPTPDRRFRSDSRLAYWRIRRNPLATSVNQSPELFTIGLNVSQTTPGRLGADFSIGTMPRALMERAAVLGARGGVVFPIAPTADVLVLPSAGVSLLGGAGEGEVPRSPVSMPASPR